MRGIYTEATDIRRRVFKEVAKLAYEETDYSKIEELPYKIIPGEIASFRESIFLERAIVGERLRLAIGLPVRDYTEYAPVSDKINDSAIERKYYDPPLINIIKFACNSCPDNVVKVTSACQRCLAHPCHEVCPVNAISFKKGRSVIDQDKCVKCGLCIKACPYDAILRMKRPCAEACGVHAISSDELGRAEIDYDKCVSCGMCLVNCPFSAIADKGQIFQTVLALKDQTNEVYAAVAPAFVGQFGPKVSVEKLNAAFKKLGFAGVVEVAIGADLCTIEEANDFMENVPDKLPFMATSCCPAWASMAKKTFPDQAKCISMALTPMVLTGRLIKKLHPNCKVVFIGPCSAKKLEASRKKVRSDIDFVLTFEEMVGIFEAKNIDLDDLEEKEMDFKASEDGRGFAASGGVAQAVVDCIKKDYPNMEINVMKADGLDNCYKMMLAAKAGKYDGYLLEGMACPGGCVAGAGTMLDINKATKELNEHKKKAPFKESNNTQYKEYLDLLD